MTTIVEQKCPDCGRGWRITQVSGTNELIVWCRHCAREASASELQTAYNEMVAQLDKLETEQ